MGGGPFARPSEPRRDSPSGASAPGALPFDCQVPEGWQPGKANSMQLAAYEVRRDGQEAAISVSTAGGDLVANVNRWREQVHLTPLDPAELKQSLRPINVDGHEGVLAELAGPETDAKPQLLVGVIVEAQGKQWFIKMRGDAGLAAREKEHFQQFVESIRFRGGK